MTRKNRSAEILLLLLLLVAIHATGSAFAQSSTWTDNATNSSWTDAGNWSSGVPGASTTVVFADPISVIGVDTGGATTIASITVNSGTSAFQIAPQVSESLVVNGNFLNNSSNTVDVNLEYTVGAISTLDGPIAFNSGFTVGTRVATIGGAVTLGSVVVIQLNNVSGTGYGRFNVGSGATLTFLGGVNSIVFSLASTYSGINGDVFNLVSNTGGTLSGFSSSLFTTSTLPTLTGGLTWNTSALNVGTLSVVPEPKTWLMLALGLTAIVISRRRRKA